MVVGVVSKKGLAYALAGFSSRLRHAVSIGLNQSVKLNCSFDCQSIIVNR